MLGTVMVGPGKGRYRTPVRSCEVWASSRWFDRSSLQQVLWTGAALLSVGVLTSCVGVAPSRIALDHSPPRGAAAAPVVAKPADNGPASATSLARVRLLSQEQYFNSIEYIFGPDIKVTTNFAPFRRTQGLLEVGASSAGVTFGQLGEFQRTATDLAAQIVSVRNRGFLLSCRPADTRRADRRCATQFLSSVGRLLYRRPLSGAALGRAVDAADSAAGRLKDFYAGLCFALSDMLLSLIHI